MNGRERFGRRRGEWGEVSGEGGGCVKMTSDHRTEIDRVLRDPRNEGRGGRGKEPDSGSEERRSGTLRHESRLDRLG